jgi:sec-independent protein translocase protein TatA
MSLGHWVVVALLALLLFGGRGKISGMMGDLAQGIKSFKKGMAEDDDAKHDDYDVIDNEPAPRRVTAKPAPKSAARKAPAKRAKAKS